MKRYFAILAVIAGCSFFLPSLINADSGFSDVPNSHNDYEATLYVQAQSIMTGSEDGKFHPELPLTRCELAKVAFVAGHFLPLTGGPLPQVFSDVPSGHWCNNILVSLKEAKIISGYSDGSFKPNQKVSQIEALKIIFNSTNVALPTVSTSSYNDVGLNDWWAPYIQYAQEYDVSYDRSGQMYGIQNQITRAETAHILFRLLGSGPQPVDSILGSFYGETLSSIDVDTFDKRIRVTHYCKGDTAIYPSLEEKISIRVCLGKDILVVSDPIYGEDILFSAETPPGNDRPVLFDVKYDGTFEILLISYPRECHINTGTCGTKGADPRRDKSNYSYDLIAREDRYKRAL